MQACARPPLHRHRRTDRPSCSASGGRIQARKWRFAATCMRTASAIARTSSPCPELPTSCSPSGRRSFSYTAASGMATIAAMVELRHARMRRSGQKRSAGTGVAMSQRPGHSEPLAGVSFRYGSVSAKATEGHSRHFARGYVASPLDFDTPICCRDIGAGWSWREARRPGSGRHRHQRPQHAQQLGLDHGLGDEAVHAGLRRVLPLLVEHGR